MTERFLTRVEQYRRTNEASSRLGEDRSIPSWIQERYDVEDLEDRSTGPIVTSIVKNQRQFPGRPFLNAFEVPAWANYFGELIVDCKSFQLSMIRVEFGCRAHGNTVDQQRKPRTTDRLAASLDPLGVGV